MTVDSYNETEFRAGMIARSLNTIMGHHKLPVGMFEDVQPIEYDGFPGRVIGLYVTIEGRVGYVVQMPNTKVVHIYQERWIKAYPEAAHSELADATPPA